MSESVPTGPEHYNQDGLIGIYNHDFMDSPTFKVAYQRGVKAAGTDHSWHWRVHIGLWPDAMASKLAGDFVGCGVNRRFLSSTIMQYRYAAAKVKRYDPTLGRDDEGAGFGHRRWLSESSWMQRAVVNAWIASYAVPSLPHR